jgi:hypothetical protein
MPANDFQTKKIKMSTREVIPIGQRKIDLLFVACFACFALIAIGPDACNTFGIFFGINNTKER